MDETEINEETEVDLVQLFQSLWQKLWIILLTAAVSGVLAFCVTKLFIPPRYESQIVMYVYNQKPSEQSQVSVSQSDLSAAQHLVDTYTVFLQSRTTLEEVLRDTNLPYRYDRFRKMVEARSVNGTEAFQVIVTSKDPHEAAQIANSIGKVLPRKIADFIPGSSVKIVDDAVPADRPCSPNALKNTLFGVLFGLFISSGAVVVGNLLDHQIHDSDYLAKTYEIPVLAEIPDLDGLAPEHHASSNRQHRRQTVRREKGGVRNG